MPQLRSIKKLCVPSETNKGDGNRFQESALKLAISALIIAVDMIMKYCRHLKYIKNIVLVTDGKGQVDWGGVEDVAQQINAQNIKLSVLYNPNQVS